MQARAPIWKFAAIGIVAIVVLTILSMLVYITSRGNGPDIGAVSISIEGRDAVLSAEYTLPPGLRVRSYDLDLVSGDKTYPVVLGDGKATVDLGVAQVADILNSGSANIAGSIKAALKFPPIAVGQDVDVAIDIASYLSLNNTLKAHNISVVFIGLGELRVSLDFIAELRSDITLVALNTSADIITAFGTTPGKIDHLAIGPDGSGEATVRVPTVSIAPLLLGNNRIIVDFWGFKFSFDYPLT
jgi:hypothetical protein